MDIALDGVFWSHTDGRTDKLILVASRMSMQSSQMNANANVSVMLTTITVLEMLGMVFI